MFLRIILLLSYVQAIGQFNPLPRNFEKIEDAKKVIVKRDCFKCDPKKNKMHIRTYYFDSKGFNTELRNFYHNTKRGKETFTWNPDGSVARVLHYYTFTSTAEFDTAKATSENNYGIVWDSTQFTETNYSYYSGKIKSITILKEDLSPSLEVAFHYNNRQLVKEVIIDYPDEGFFGIGFKPNSSEFIPMPDAGDTTIKFKDYEYRNDSVYILYYKNEILTGRGKQKLDSDGRILYEATYNLNNELINEIQNEYNFRGQLMEQKKFETGYNGFGDGYDFVMGDRFVYEYDNKGRLQTKTEYDRGKVFLIEYYEYY